MTLQASLFDAPQTSPFGEAAGWVSALISGQMVVAICTIAVALFGFQLLMGRLRMARGMRTVFGIFILLGAPTIAVGMMAWVPEEAGPTPLTIIEPQRDQQTRGELPEANYDPYAGASLRRD